MVMNAWNELPCWPKVRWMGMGMEVVGLLVFIAPTGESNIYRQNLRGILSVTMCFLLGFFYR